MHCLRANQDNLFKTVGFWGFPCGLTSKESAHSAGDLGSIPGLGRFPGEGNSYWPGEFHGLYSPWGHKELDTTERLSLSLSLFNCICFFCKEHALLFNMTKTIKSIFLIAKKTKGF